MTDRSRAISALVLVTALWGTSFPMTKCLNLQLDQQFEGAMARLVNTTFSRQVE